MKWPFDTAPTSRRACRTWSSLRIFGNLDGPAMAADRMAALYCEDLWGFGTMAERYLRRGPAPVGCRARIPARAATRRGEVLRGRGPQPRACPRGWRRAS